MRISVILEAEREIILPIQYNHILQGFLYENLSDKDYREFLHHTGYREGRKTFRLFTYSRLLGKFRLNQKLGQISFQPPVEIIISSAVEQFITDLAETLIKSDSNLLGNNRVEVKSISVHKNVQFGPETRIKMLSPVVAYTTLHNDDLKYTYYLSPWKKQFIDIVRNNLLAKHEVIHGYIPDNQELSIIPNGNQEKKFEKILNYKGTVIKGYAGIYWLKGSPELIKVAYDTGLGSKNSQGFGCWEVAGVG
jgi:CRISPR-associated endoribonuclease Cas6